VSECDNSVSIQVRERVNVVGGGQASHLFPHIAYSRHPICMKSYYLRGGESLAILFFVIVVFSFSLMNCAVNEGVQENCLCECSGGRRIVLGFEPFWAQCT